MKLLCSISIAGLLIISTSYSCKKSNGSSSGNNVDVPAIYSKIYGATSITSDGTFITIKTNGTPDHKSVYYPTTNSLYEPFSGPTFGGNAFHKNPNTIATQNLTFKIPVNPTVASNHAARLK